MEVCPFRGTQSLVCTNPASPSHRHCCGRASGCLLTVPSGEALIKHSGMREGIPDISGSEGRSPEPRLLSRSDWLPPPALMARGCAAVLRASEGSVETDRNKGKSFQHLTVFWVRETCQPSLPFPFPFFFWLLFY